MLAAAYAGVVLFRTLVFPAVVADFVVGLHRPELHPAVGALPAAVRRVGHVADNLAAHAVFPDAVHGQKRPSAEFAFSGLRQGVDLSLRT